MPVKSEKIIEITAFTVTIWPAIPTVTLKVSPISIRKSIARKPDIEADRPDKIRVIKMG